MAGLPVIITQSVGARDLVDFGIHGFVLKEGPSPLDIAEKLKVLMKRENRLKMGENAKKLALHHTWERKGSQVTELYRSLFHDIKLT